MQQTEFRGVNGTGSPGQVMAKPGEAVEVRAAGLQYSYSAGRATKPARTVHYPRLRSQSHKNHTGNQARSCHLNTKTSPRGNGAARGGKGMCIDEVSET